MPAANFSSEALDFAARMHSGQKRQGGDEYITHPIAVTELLRGAGYPLEYQLTGLFHDLLEDTPATLAEIARIAGQDVAAAIKLLTKEDGYVMADYIARIKASPMAAAVKAADRYHNLRCAVQATENFKRKYILESMAWYLDFAQYGFDITQAIRDLAKTLVEPIPDLDLPL